MDAGRFGEDLLDLSRHCARAFQRSRIRKLHVDEGIALVFIGQEARGQTHAKENCDYGESRNYKQSQRAFAKNPGADFDVDLGGAPEHAIEPVKESAEQPVALLLRPKQQRGKRGAQRERIEGGEHHRNGDGHGKLLVEPSGDARDECCRYKHRGENQGNRHDGTGEFLHGFQRRVLGSHPFLDVALDALDDHDGVVHHETDGQHQTKQRKGVDGKTEEGEKGKGAHQRNGHG